MIQLCKFDKVRNVADKLPDHLAATDERDAGHSPTHPRLAEAQMEALARELERLKPGAAGSLTEDRTETLTVLRMRG